MCSIAVSTLDFPAGDPRSNSGSGIILMSENLRLDTTSKCSPVTNQTVTGSRLTGYIVKRDALSSNRKVDG